jgi:hypothetical protein
LIDSTYIWFFREMSQIALIISAFCTSFLFSFYCFHSFNYLYRYSI